jgi:hypothetical protein
MPRTREYTRVSRASPCGVDDRCVDLGHVVGCRAAQDQAFGDDAPR